jgi:hypothetical protein
MGDDHPDVGPENTEYKILRIPDLQTVSKGAQVRYACVWKAGGDPPQGWNPDGSVGARDGIRWYLYSAAANWLGENFKSGPIDDSWTFTWDKPPGAYCVIALIRSPGGPETFLYRPQTVGEAGAMLRAPLDQLIQKGSGPSPDDGQREIDRFRKLLDEDAQRMPPADPAKHKESVDRWTEISDRLRSLLAPSAGKRRYPMRAIHLDAATQARSVLMLFLTELGTDDLHGRFGSRTNHRWALVDWTDTGNPRFRGTYEGSGSNILEAVNACFSSWSLDNRYPEGHVTFDIPKDLYPFVGGDQRRQMDTSGKNITDRIISVLGWIAVGGLFVAGFCFMFVAVPAAMDLALAASMVTSTAASAISIGQRWRDGIFDWKADAIDGLTIAAGIIGAGAWARGNIVKTVASGGKTIDRIFIGTRVGGDALQGVLVTSTGFDQLDAIKKDTSLTPEERSHRIIVVIGTLAAAGFLTVISLKASGKAADNLNEQPNHLPNDPRASVPEEKLQQITNPDGPPMEIGERQIGEGDTTASNEHKTSANTPIEKPPVPLKPDETDLAKRYPADGHPWREHEITDNKIVLVDKDFFQFKCTITKKGTLHVEIIVTKIDPKTTSKHLLDQMPPTDVEKRSDVLRAWEVYKLAYRHFEQIGNPVKWVRGEFAWDNYAGAKEAYDKLLKLPENKNRPRLEVAKEAVKSSLTYRYHAAEGMSTITYAKDNPVQSLFNYRLGPGEKIPLDSWPKPEPKAEP